MTQTIKCFCCEATAPKGTGSSVGSIAQASGFTPFMDVSDGLVVVYTCPTHTAVAKEASKLLRSVFGDKLSYIHMRAVADLSEES